MPLENWNGRVRHDGIWQFAVKGTETHTAEAPIPILEWHPYLEIDRRLHDTGDAAERPMNLDRSGQADTTLCPCNCVRAVCMNRLRARDAGLRQREIADRRARSIHVTRRLRVQRGGKRAEHEKHEVRMS